jgi:DNA-binding XRE family transcriptional regulator
MITAGQLRVARALVDVDQRTLAEIAGVSVQTIQRMEASDNLVRGVVESLAKVIDALDRLGVEVINDAAPSSSGGRGVRLRVAETTNHKARDTSSGMLRKKRSLGASSKWRPGSD